MSTKEPQKQPMGYIEMSHICNECSEEDCETSYMNGTCKLALQSKNTRD